MKKYYANGIIYYANQKPAVRTERSIRSPRTEEFRPSHRVSKIDNRLVMGQVTILRRDDTLDSINSKIIRKDDKISLSKNKSEPEMSPKKIRVGRFQPNMYAGSAAFLNSSSPRALPFPSFFNNKSQEEYKLFATRDLRQLLQLEQ